MSITNIVAGTDTIYWFVDTGASVVSGVTGPGLVTSSAFPIEHSKDLKTLAKRLGGIPNVVLKLRLRPSGFCVVDNLIVFREPSDKDLDSEIPKE